MTIKVQGVHHNFIEEYVRGKRVVFRFAGPMGFDGCHGYDVLALDKNQTELRETLKMNTYGIAQLSWPLIFRPLHDALIEVSLSLAEMRLGLVPTVTKWSWWVRILRWVISSGKSRSQKLG